MHLAAALAGLRQRTLVTAVLPAAGLCGIVFILSALLMLTLNRRCVVVTGVLAWGIAVLCGGIIAMDNVTPWETPALTATLASATVLGWVCRWLAPRPQPAREPAQGAGARIRTQSAMEP